MIACSCVGVRVIILASFFVFITEEGIKRDIIIVFPPFRRLSLSACDLSKREENTPIKRP